MRFADIPGHADVKARLIQMVDSAHLPHALMLEGPAGSAKFALARALAQYVHCTQPILGQDSCGRCPNCLQHASFNHIDTIYCFPVIKKGSVALSNDYLPEFRSFITDNPFMDADAWPGLLGNPNAQPQIYVDEAAELGRRLTFTARQSDYKIVLLWLPERMQESAANKLLKLIEEPAADTLFFMTSDNPRAVLPTIYSRTQRVRVRRYTDTEVASWLMSSFPVAEDDASAIAALAEGNLVTASGLIGTQQERSHFLELFKQLMRLAYQRSVRELRAWSLEVAALGREGIMRFLEYCARMVRENYIYNLGSPTLNALSSDEMQFSSRFAPFINERNVEALSAEIDCARADIGANANSKIVVFDLAIKTILLLKR